MTRNEFMTALRRRLGHLPPDEQDAAMKYYEEYFDEAASEEEAAQQLGSPDRIADRILADYAPPAQAAAPHAEKPKHSAGYWVGFVLLCLCAAPIVLPLAAGAAAAALGLLAALLGLLISVILPFAALAVALLGCFFLLLYLAAVSIPYFLPGSILLIGAALLCGAFGLLSGVFTGYLCYWTGLLCSKIVSSIKRNKAGAAK